jgi:hypothetical protein
MDWLYWALTKPFDWLLSPFGSWNPLVSLSFFAVVASVLLLLIFRRLSNQEALRQTRGRIKAHLLEVRLFGHDVRLVWAAEKKIAVNNAIYLKLLLKPLVATLPVFVWFAVGLEAWFESRPLRPGEAAVVSVFWEASPFEQLPEPTLAGSAGVRIETPGLRIPAQGRADWRVRALEPGEHVLRCGLSGSEIEGRVSVATVRLARIARSASPSGSNPAGAPVRFQRMEVDYPDAVLSLAGLEFHWFTAFLVLSVLFAVVLKGPMGVII